MRILCHANDRFEADLISDTLTIHGIFSRIKVDEQPHPNSATQFGEGLEVHVKDEDFEQAARVLKENVSHPANHH